MKNELKNIIANDDDDVNFHLASSPSKGYTSTQKSRAQKLLQMKTAAVKTTDNPNRSYNRSLSKDSAGTTGDSRPAASSRMAGRR